MTRMLIAVSLVLVGVLVSPLLSKDEPASVPPAPQPFNAGAEWEITPQSAKAVERGLAWLSKKQNDDGTYGSQGGYGRHAGITGLAGLAFLAEGSVPGRGRYCQNVERCLDATLANTSDSSGLICTNEASSGPMYGHGFATLFLAEAYGMTGNEQVREKLRLAIRLITNTQVTQENNRARGGWRYMPVPQDADMSVTICQTMALRAARNAGIKVDKKTIDLAIDYVHRSHGADGGFTYTPNGAGMGGSTFPCTAAAVASLYYSGVYGGKDVQAGVNFIYNQRNALGNANGAAGFGHFFYGHYYSVQAMFLVGGDKWKAWYTALRDCVVRMQQADGSWTDGVGPEFATSMALIILQVPNRYLPILER